MPRYVQPEYIPTPLEISQACAAIRSHWSPRERQRRFVGRLIAHDYRLDWKPPVIDTSSLRAASGKPMCDLVS
mgnify:CR=1 FL=1